MIALPPFDDGALQRAVMDVSATVVLTLVGAVGTPALVVPATREESELAPAGADTSTATQYCVFPLKLLITHVADDVVQELNALPPVSALYAVAVYEVAPLAAVQLAVSELAVGVPTVSPVGGGMARVEVSARDDAAPVPSVLVAVTDTQ